MTAPRFHVPGLIEDGMDLPAAVSHHMIRVLRLRVGDPVTLFNGTGGEYQCKITAISRKQAQVKVLAYSAIDRAPQLHIHLGLAVLKKDAMDRVIQYAAELGIGEITPVITEHCSVATRIIRSRQAHWQQVAIAACEQSGMNRLPTVHTPTDLAGWRPQESDCKLICVPGAAPLSPSLGEAGRVCILTGPEGGLTDEEIRAAEAVGFTAVSFGERVLRAETAPLVAVTVLHRLWGDY